MYTEDNVVAPMVNYENQTCKKYKSNSIIYRGNQQKTLQNIEK